MTKVAIIGFGRMGREILKQCVANRLEVVSVVDSADSVNIGKDAGSLAGLEPLGVDVTGSDNLSSTLDNAKPEVVIDFSSPEACTHNTWVVTNKGIDLVIGTTGFSAMQLEEIRENIVRCGVGAVISPNMSVGVNVFWKIVSMAASLLEDYDIEIIEKHHKFKRDAPSGTALKTARVIAETLGKDLDEIGVYGRKGLGERKTGEVGMHAVRAGGIVGDHTVLYATESERIEITHMAHTRAAFASGVVRAANYVRGKKGVYDMNDVLGINEG